MRRWAVIYLAYLLARFVGLLTAWFPAALLIGRRDLVQQSSARGESPFSVSNTSSLGEGLVDHCRGRGMWP
jgi:hypothetical protein